jgi:hypothetical protein
MQLNSKPENRMNLPKIKHSIMGFTFETCQLIEITHHDGTQERVRGTAQHITLKKAGDIQVTKIIPTLSISYAGETAYFPLLLTGSI